MLEVRAVPPGQGREWDGFVQVHPRAVSYHLWGWREVLGPGLGHRAHYLGAYDGSQLRGVLPLIHLRRPLLGAVLCSLPFVNYGGILADDAEVRQALLDHAIGLARRLKVGELELRQVTADLPPLTPRTHRVALSLPLTEDPDLLWKKLGSKLRNQVRKADKEGLRVSRGGLALLNDFYAVFARNMRDLGSPVWPKCFFRHMLEAFPERTRLYVVGREGQPMAGGFVLRFRQEVEIPWASSLREFNPLCPNVRLYWEILSDACREGYQRFDFGRSAPDGPHFRFKTQWGAQAQTLHWYSWPESSPRGLALEGGREQLEALWQKLPLPLARVLGPPIRRLLPQ